MPDANSALPWIVTLIVAISPFFTKIVELLIEKLTQKKKSKTDFIKQQYFKKQKAFEDFLKAAGYAISNKDITSYNEMKRAQANALMYANEEMHENILNVSGWVNSSTEGKCSESVITKPIAQLSVIMQNDLLIDYIKCIKN